MLIALIAAGWLVTSATLAFTIGKAIRIADIKENIK